MNYGSCSFRGSSDLNHTASLCGDSWQVFDHGQLNRARNHRGRDFDTWPLTSTSCHGVRTLLDPLFVLTAASGRRACQPCSCALRRTSCVSTLKLSCLVNVGAGDRCNSWVKCQIIALGWALDGAQCWRLPAALKTNKKGVWIKQSELHTEGCAVIKCHMKVQ